MVVTDSLLGHKKLIQRARTWMLFGLLWSYFGTTVVGGAVPVLVSLGLLPLLWLPLMATLESLQDMCSAAAARVLRRFEAGKILVQCEIADVGLTVVAAAFVFTLDRHWSVVVLCVYTAATSFLPLFIDLAEEFYGAEIEEKDPGSAAKFNTYLYAAMPAVSQFASGPLGSLLAGWSILTVLSVNAAASLLAIAARYRSLRLGRRVGIGDAPATSPPPQDDAVEHTTPGHDKERAIMTLRSLARLQGPGSPLFSAAVPLATGLSAVYLGQWAASFTSNKGPFFAVTAICVGIGALVGPFLARAAVSRIDASIVLYAGSLLTAALMGAGALYVVTVDPVASAGSHLIIVIGYLIYTTLTTLLLSGVGVTQITARQQLFQGDRFVQVMSWGHSLAAAGALIGVWAGLLLQTAQRPASALMLGGILLALTFLLLRPGRSTTT